MPCQLEQDPHDIQYYDGNSPVVSYTLVLEDDERVLNVPEDLQHRVDSRTYTWRLFFADHEPEVSQLDYGRIGDIWVNKAVGEENIWIKTGVDTCQWNVWHKKIDYGTKKWNNSQMKFRHSYHPWLQDRLLQFSGTALGWFPRRQYHYHRSSWNQDKLTRGYLNAPTYDELDVAWVARHIWSSVPPAVPDEGTHTITLSSASEVTGGLPASESPDSLVMTEKLEPQLSVPLPPQNKRRYSGSVVEETACKRRRSQDEGSISPIRELPPHIQSRPASALPPPPLPPPMLTEAFNLEQYLAALPLSLSQHTHIFATLGFTERVYFDSVALIPKHFANEVIATLRERGLTFMETLVFRNALNTIRRSAPVQQTTTRTEPDNIRTFLAGLCPPLERCAPIFHDLGIDVAHIPVLSQLDAESYLEFEKTLEEADVTWVEVLLIRAGVKGLAEGRHEPLLLAV
ncbi:hypothetical protein L227DRAFT_237852 [Lentinus tigrinus ALCF2SS1-6]|uniref:Uncharacterized protein n=1 Tax=Lentinus tigrinus ALCF2SS1-6 TaxID=1328759 RepID=A0A5C2S166_9APHY|nr:hypothetical protein L227DRAFT_237852 [Lentinus tigrinus ALCF2SS1-6]